MARGIQRVVWRRRAFEIFTDSASVERLAARALSAGWCHDRFASRHEPGGKVTRRFGDGRYSPPVAGRLVDRGVDSPPRRTLARRSVLPVGLRAVLSVNVLSGRGHLARHEGLWPSVGRPSDPS
jgi:hypothetical protein